tara:strand:+ start:1000 stop:1425 length:426 start_codon:yes stop_codon:yes gene_type:complete
MPRCCINVYDKLTHRNRKCLHNRKWGPICSFHARYYIIKIQSAWRSYKTKTKVNIYKNLPSDLWEIVLYYIQQNNNIYKLYLSHANVYQKRLNEFANLRFPVGQRFLMNGRVFYRDEYNLLTKYLDETKQNLKYFNKLLMK